MPDDDDRPGHALERRAGRAGAVLEARVGIVVGQIRRYGFVTPRAQRLNEGIPA